jgi:hypothetical protein
VVDGKNILALTRSASVMDVSLGDMSPPHVAEAGQLEKRDNVYRLHEAMRTPLLVSLPLFLLPLLRGVVLCPVSVSVGGSLVAIGKCISTFQ